MKVIITGASDGLGYELAKLFLTDGHEVVNISRSKPDIKVEHISADFTDPESIKVAVNEIKKKHPDFNILVNNAGMIKTHSLDAIDYNEVQEVLQVNTIAPAVLTSGLIPLIKKNKADIVNIGSTIAFKAYPEQAAYVMSKWGMRGFTNYLQVELQGPDIRVIGFYPGGMATKFFEKNLGQEVKGKKYMNPKSMAEVIYQVIKLPKNMEVSEIIVNRKSL